MALSYSTGLVNGVLTTGGDSFADMLGGFVIDIYSGTKPASADAAVVTSSTTVLLGTITKGGVAATGDASVYTLHMGVATARAIDKNTAETWQFRGTVAGVAAWFRMRNPSDPGTASSTDVRIDGTIGTYSGDARLSSTDIVADNIYTLHRFKLTWPSTV